MNRRRTDPDRDRKRYCPKCFGLSHRRAPQGCLSCGEPHAPEAITPSETQHESPCAAWNEW